jgi:hypothetical protein
MLIENPPSVPALDAPPEPVSFKRVFLLSWKALLLDKAAYQPLLTGDHSIKRGAKFILLLMLPISLAVLIGLIFDYLTLPRVYLIEDKLFALVSSIPLLEQTAAENPTLAFILLSLYRLTWWLVRTTIGYPSTWDVVTALPFVLISGLFNWFTAGFFAKIIAGWMGGKARGNAIYAAMAPASSPYLLYLLEVIPGLNVPSTLVTGWMFMTHYQAIRVTYQFSWGRSLLVILLSVLLQAICLILSVVIGVLIGVLVSKFILT